MPQFNLGSCKKDWKDRFGPIDFDSNGSCVDTTRRSPKKTTSKAKPTCKD